jgi:hypothetical protein
VKVKFELVEMCESQADGRKRYDGAEFAQVCQIFLFQHREQNGMYVASYVTETSAQTCPSPPRVLQKAPEQTPLNHHRAVPDTTSSPSHVPVMSRLGCLG